MAAIEGKATDGRTRVMVLMEGEELLMCLIEMDAGGVTPPHSHEHESAGLLLQGRLRTTIDGKTYELEVGDGFWHPAGMEHWVEALEDAVWLEVKAPAHRAWS
jgi:quercetin dioxygenase-like cupin family protein